MAHGGPPEWNEAVLESVKPLKAKYDVEVAFGMADAASLQESVQKLEARNVRKIGVVRLFVSGETSSRKRSRSSVCATARPLRMGNIRFTPVTRGTAWRSFA